MNNRENISPLDSRYSSKLEAVRKIFSEDNLIKTRVDIERLWLLFLTKYTASEAPEFGGKLLPLDSKFTNDFPPLVMFDKETSKIDIDEIERIEEETGHDVAAMVQYFRGYLKDNGVSPETAEYVHFGLTSQDIMTTGYNLVVKEYMTSRFGTALSMVTETMSKDRFDVIFLGRTHGQPAIPTSFKKEFNSYEGRINTNYNNLYNHIENMTTKFGGAINNFAAAKYCNNKIDWELALDTFIKEFCGLGRSHYGTQTDNYESLCKIFDSMAAIADVLTDFCRDVWMYCMFGYFKINYPKDHVGSSTMAQKVNPIDFENAEGNLEVAVMWLKFLSSRLRKSRLQRDLSDSTIMRNLGLPFAHFDLAMQGIIHGLNKITINEEIVAEELENNYQILAEAVQTKLKYAGVLGAFDKVKHLFKGKSLDQHGYIHIINDLDVGKQLQDELRELTPKKYFY